MAIPGQWVTDTRVKKRMDVIEINGVRQMLRPLGPHKPKNPLDTRKIWVLELIGGKQIYGERRFNDDQDVSQWRQIFI